VAEEAATLLDVDGAWIEFYDGEDVVKAVEWSRPGKHPPTFDRVKLADAPVAAAVRRSGATVRIDDFEDIQPTTIFAETPGAMSVAGAPIMVEGRQWGLMLAWSQDSRLPPDTETQLTAFTELVATAIANTDARVQVQRLADEQAALRRVATLVAEGVAPTDVFGAVAEEVGRLLRVDSTHLARYELDGTVTSVGSWSSDGSHRSVGARVPLDGTSVTGLVFNTGRPARLDDYERASDEIATIIQEMGVRSSVGAPIVVDGQPWGALISSSTQPSPLPSDTESRIARFAALVATAISNTEARTETRRLAEEQAALRRVATLVAEAVPPEELFNGVVTEVGGLLGADFATMMRFEPDKLRLMAIWSAAGEPAAVEGIWPLEPEGLTGTIAKTGQPARVAHRESAPGTSAAIVRDQFGLMWTVGSPIVVAGRLWGALMVHSTHDEPPPVETEAHLEQFTDLVATAIANSQARSDLAASRGRIVAAADDERRRVVRDLHDGAQQRLVHTVVILNMARTALAEEREDAADLVSEALQHAEAATGELRELAHGILPSVLTDGGLRAGVGALASRMPLPIENAVSVERLPRAIEATAYFVVAEALTNVAKHSQASHAVVTAQVGDDTLHIQVRDDGVGGALASGTGLIGLADRVSALKGTLRLESPADGGTLVVAEIPVAEPE
jgi:signal transduction histidine kinase